MQGADEYYDLLDKADNYHLIKRINCYGYGYGFQHENIVFIISTHARGKCFCIWIYENSEIQDTLKDSHLEVYGITGGQSGWTETYGWTCEGSFVNYITNYLDSLEKQVYEYEHADEIAADKAQKEREERFNKKVAKFDQIFSSMK